MDFNCLFNVLKRTQRSYLGNSYAYTKKSEPRKRIFSRGRLRSRFNFFSNSFYSWCNQLISRWKWKKLTVLLKVHIFWSFVYSYECFLFDKICMYFTESLYEVVVNILAKRIKILVVCFRHYQDVGCFGHRDQIPLLAYSFCSRSWSCSFIFQCRGNSYFCISTT